MNKRMVSLYERRFRGLCSQLEAAKANNDRVLAGEAYDGLHAITLHAECASIRQNAADMIDHAELEWYVADIERAASYEEWLYKRIASYARAAPHPKRRVAILSQIRSVAEADKTPETAVYIMREFLAAPDAWPPVAIEW